LARSHGISMADGGARSSFPAGHRVLAEWQSAQLRDIVGGMLRYSTNLTAEVVGLSATRALGGEVSNLRESGAHMASWFQEHVRMPRASFLDHSGLGDLSRVSAFAMAGALRQLGPSVDLASLMKTAPMLDRAGNAIRNSPAQVRAKTGTLNFVSALGGYITAPDGRELVFAIFCADTARRAGLSKAQRERPDGGRSWTRRARKLHGQLLARWAAIYSV
ncbi:MAG: D-alanyl-D-alanine carboxypeptidase, partial [Pseudomonadota bacterium]